MKDLTFITPAEGDPKYDEAYEYRLMLGDTTVLMVMAPGQRIEIKRFKKPKPLTPEGLVEEIAEQLQRDGEIKDTDELARRIREYYLTNPLRSSVE